MEKLIRPWRLAIMAIITALLIVVSVVTLYKLQIVTAGLIMRKAATTTSPPSA